MSVDVPSLREPSRLDPQRHSGRDVALVDLIDRLLAGGVVLSGEIILAAADIDLVRVDLRALISSVPEGDRTR